MTKTVLGQKIKVGKKRVASDNEAVFSYLKAAREGKGLARKTLSKLKKETA